MKNNLLLDKDKMSFYNNLNMKQIFKKIIFHIEKHLFLGHRDQTEKKNRNGNWWKTCELTTTKIEIFLFAWY